MPTINLDKNKHLFKHESVEYRQLIYRLHPCRYLGVWVFLQEKSQLKRARALQSETVAKWPQWYTLCPGRCASKRSLTILKRFIWLARVCSVELCATVLCKLTLVPDYWKPRAWPNQNRLARKFTDLLLKELNDRGRDFLLVPFKFEKSFFLL